MVGARTTLGRRLGAVLDYTWPEMEKTVLLKDPATFDVEMIQEEQEMVKREAEKSRPGLIIFTDGSRLESGAAGYAVA